jgi:hypothetical protein
VNTEICSNSGFQHLMKLPRAALCLRALAQCIGVQKLAANALNLQP